MATLIVKLENKEHTYDLYLVYQIGLLKDSLSKELVKDSKLLINMMEIKKLNYSKYYISYYQGRKYERTKEIVHKIINTNDIKFRYV